MLIVKTLSASQIRERQSVEARPYWSAAAGDWLRKWGLLALDREAPETPRPEQRHFTLYTRGAASSRLPGPSFVEGPIDAGLLAAAGVEARNELAKTVRLEIEGGLEEIEGLAEGDQPDRFGYAYDLMRRIPATNAEKSEPTPFDEAGTVGGTDLHFQTFTRMGENWRSLAYAVTASGRRPAVITDGEVIFSGLPLFDLFAEKMSMPALPHGYYSPIHLTAGWRHERWLVDLLIGCSLNNGSDVIRLSPWPDGRRAALSIRHDYDRPIASHELARILSAYELLGVKASCGFLARLTPQAQGCAMRAAGHEICLHSERGDEAGAAAEIDALTAAFGERPTGLTAHGGAGAVGHLGERQYRLAEALGFSHAETLDRFNHLPHAALVAEENGPRRTGVMIMGLHDSIDAGTAPDAHRLAEVRARAAATLALGGHANIMNHPDIHVGELLDCLAGLSLDDVWCATHGDIADWTRRAKYGARLVASGEGYRIDFEAPVGRRVEVLYLTPDKGDARRVEKILAPAEAASVDIAGEPVRKSAPAETGFVAPGGAGKKGRANAGGPGGEKLRRLRAMTQKFDGPVGAIVRRQAEINQYWDEMAAAADLDAAATAPRIYAASGGGVGLPSPFGPPSTIFSQPVNGFYDAMVIARTVRMFDGPWGRSLIALANAMTKPGGEVILPLSSKDPAPVLFNINVLCEIFGQQGRLSPCKRYIAFEQTDSVRQPKSIFSWAVENAATLFMEETSGAAAQASDDPLLQEFMTPSEEAEAILDRVRGDRADVAGDDAAAMLNRFTGSMDYLVTGIGYKAPLIAHIIRQQMKDRREIDYLDMGGGFGALAGELLLTPDINIARAETRDIAPQNVLYARRLYAACRQEFRDRFHFSLGRSETFDFDRPRDVVSFVGSLLYVPRREVKAMLGKLWDALRAGGLLIVHENIKAPAYTRDFDVMFEPDELEGFLRPFGEIRYYASTSLSELAAGDVERKTVFRVVQKP